MVEGVRIELTIDLRQYVVHEVTAFLGEKSGRLFLVSCQLDYFPSSCLDLMVGKLGFNRDHSLKGEISSRLQCPL